MLLANVVAQYLLHEGVDISNAYLYGDLDKRFLMQQPSKSSGVVRKLNWIDLAVKSLFVDRSAGQLLRQLGTHEDFIMGILAANNPNPSILHAIGQRLRHPRNSSR